MDTASLFITIALLILLAVTSPCFGVDNREGFTAKEQTLTPRGNH